jgi:hypothetical protein
MYHNSDDDSELGKAHALLDSSPLTLQRGFGALQSIVDVPEDIIEEENIAIDVPDSVARYIDVGLKGRLALAQEQAQGILHSHRAEGVGSMDVLLEYGNRLQEVVAAVEDVLQRRGQMNGGDVSSSLREVDLVGVLQKACDVYQHAHDCSGGTDAKVLFNWAVVLSDIARLVGGSEEKIEYAVASCLKYCGVVAIEGENAQALNNWGLVICDLANYCSMGSEEPSETKRHLFTLAISRFRKAIRQYDSIGDHEVLSRCSYNMGTVMYHFATLYKDDVQMNLAHASQYILLAHAFDSQSEVFKRAVKSVLQYLPLPYLRYSRLVYVFDESREERGVQQWLPRGLALDALHLKTIQLSSMDMKDISQSDGSSTAYHSSIASSDMEIDVLDITSCCISMDPWIPTGYGMHIRLKGSKYGIFISAQSREEVQGWKDIINLLQALNIFCSSAGLHKLQKILVNQSD